MVETSIKSQLKQAIQDVSAKSSEISNGNLASDLAASKAAQAQNAISAKESLLETKQLNLDSVNEKIDTPPTKEADGGGCRPGKTIVDQTALQDLKAQRQATLAQVNQAKSEVANAREEAATSSAEALEKVGVSREQQSEMQSLIGRIASAQDSLSEGKPVKDEDVAKLITDFKTIADNLTKDENQSGLISKTFYSPIKEGLQKISNLMDKNAADAAAAKESSSDSKAERGARTNDNAREETETIAPVGAGVGD